MILEAHGSRMKKRGKVVSARGGRQFQEKCFSYADAYRNSQKLGQHTQSLPKLYLEKIPEWKSRSGCEVPLLIKELVTVNSSLEGSQFCSMG